MWVYKECSFQDFRTNIKFNIKIIPQCTKSMIFRDLLNGNIVESKLCMKKNSIRAVYNHAQHLDERRKIMQVWADFLDFAFFGEDAPKKEAGKTSEKEDEITEEFEKVKAIK